MVSTLCVTPFFLVVMGKKGWHCQDLRDLLREAPQGSSI